MTKLLPCLLTLLAAGADLTFGQGGYLGGSFRYYQFLRAEGIPFSIRTDGETGIFRVTHESSLGSKIRFEVHGIAGFQSPPLIISSRLAVSPSRTFLPLEYTFMNCPEATGQLALDRLNLTLQLGSASITLGRQPVTWGVAYFWPSLDFFSPFAPQQLDRDYKAGADAIRVNVPIGSLSEFELVGGILGPSLNDDGVATALLRWNLGAVDAGIVGGRVHRDTVAGIFLTSNVKGTGLRGELTWTQSGEPADWAIDRKTFWRGSVGVDRQLTPTLTLVSEFAFNGFGTDDPKDYTLLLTADRVLRGEVSGLGRADAGVSLAWMAHPLLSVNNLLLLNPLDPSALWVPSLQWSTSNNSDLLFGCQLGIGEAFGPDTSLESEYGVAPWTFFAVFRLYL